MKTTWAKGRLMVNAAYYRITWDDMQLNVPTPGAPAQFYIANVGNAKSSGVEVAMNARPMSALDLYGTFGTADATFGTGSLSGGVDVSGNDLPLAPGYTASARHRSSRRDSAARRAPTAAPTSSSTGRITTTT